MTKEQLWQKLIAQNPEFASSGFNFSAKGLRKFFDLIADQSRTDGYQDGLDEGKKINDMMGIYGKSGSDILGQIFGADFKNK